MCVSWIVHLFISSSFFSFFKFVSSRLKSRRSSTSLFQLRQSAPWSARRASTSSSSPTSLELQSRWVHLFFFPPRLLFGRSHVHKAPSGSQGSNSAHCEWSSTLEPAGIRAAATAGTTRRIRVGAGIYLSGGGWGGWVGWVGRQQ